MNLKKKNKMNKYFIVLENKKEGPFSKDELKAKGISQSTLVWNEKMDNWIEAKKVEDLQDILTLIPPDIPTYENKKTETILANELKINAKMLLYAFIIFIISFPTIFYFKNGFAHYSLKQKWTKYNNGQYYSDYYFEIDKASYKLGYTKYLNLQNDMSLNFYEVEHDEKQNHINFHSEKYKAKLIGSIWPSILTFIFSSIIMIFGRYITKGSNWVKLNSN